MFEELEVATAPLSPLELSQLPRRQCVVACRETVLEVRWLLDVFVWFAVDEDPPELDVFTRTTAVVTAVEEWVEEWEAPDGLECETAGLFDTWASPADETRLRAETAAIRGT